jgi:hypothetical protein
VRGRRRNLLSGRTFLTTISVFELLDEVAIAQPNRDNRSAVESFAAYYTHYWNPNLKPTPGYAPRTGQRGGVAGRKYPVPPPGCCELTPAA